MKKCLFRPHYCEEPELCEIDFYHHLKMPHPILGDVSDKKYCNCDGLFYRSLTEDEI
jgi:hypothetical protein